MYTATLLSRAQAGLSAPLVRVEAHCSGGLSRFTLVGLPAKAVSESRERVRAAIINCGFRFPAGRITVNLAPADIPKEGGRFDLPIALGILAASQQLPAAPDTWAGHEFYGELALDGGLRRFYGALPVALAARDADRLLVMPRENRDEANLVRATRVATAEHLNDVVAHLLDRVRLDLELPPALSMPSVAYPDLADVRGQPHARRALEIAAAGGHSLLMIGPPGTGKTMLAARLPGLLPDLDEDQALQSAALASLSGVGFRIQDWRRRPFRAPHHTASAVALVGGGSNPRPGEISLAHNGVLFLDELPEFRRDVLEVLRQPLETGNIVISRAAGQACFPCRFQLIAAMNPCPCGYRGDSRLQCLCGDQQVSRYRTRISGPLLDRIDLQIEVPRVEQALLYPEAPPGESSACVRQRVLAARHRQQQRAGRENALLDDASITEFCGLEAAATGLLEQAIEKYALSARACRRVLRLARSIADLDGADRIETTHLAEALGYRLMMRTPVC